MTKLEQAGLAAGLAWACILMSVIAIVLNYVHSGTLASVFWFGLVVGTVVIVRYNRLKKAAGVE